MKRILFAIVLICEVLYVEPATASDTNTNDWVKWDESSGGNGHWYKAVATNTTWAEAEALARSEGGYLATITSAEENDFVFNLINSPAFFADVRGAGSGPAIGGSQAEGAVEPDGGWTWITGEEWSFSYWSVGEPNNYYPKEDRLHYWSGTPGVPVMAWNDIREDDFLGGYIVERSANLQPTRSGLYGQVFVGNPRFGTPIPATVLIRQISGPTFRTLPTNPVGQFYSFVNPGDYTVIVARRGQRISPRSINQNPGAYFTTNVTVFPNHLSQIQIGIEAP